MDRFTTSPFDSGGMPVLTPAQDDVISHHVDPQHVEPVDEPRVAPMDLMDPPNNLRKRKAPTLRAKDWEPYKDRIVELHIAEGKPLQEVKAEIEKESGFIAELRQYRTRISQWKLDKNVKPGEMKAIVSKRQRRRLNETDKNELSFTVRSTPVDPQKIDRWMTRHNVPEDQLYNASPAASTPSAVLCRTISNPSTPAQTSTNPVKILTALPTSNTGSDPIPLPVSPEYVREHSSMEQDLDTTKRAFVEDVLGTNDDDTGSMTPKDTSGADFIEADSSPSEHRSQVLLAASLLEEAVNTNLILRLGRPRFFSNFPSIGAFDWYSVWLNNSIQNTSHFSQFFEEYNVIRLLWKICSPFDTYETHCQTDFKHYYVTTLSYFFDDENYIVDNKSERWQLPSFYQDSSSQLDNQKLFMRLCRCLEDSIAFTALAIKSPRLSHYDQMRILLLWMMLRALFDVAPKIDSRYYRSLVLRAGLCFSQSLQAGGIWTDSWVVILHVLQPVLSGISQTLRCTDSDAAVAMLLSEYMGVFLSAAEPEIKGRLHRPTKELAMLSISYYTIFASVFSIADHDERADILEQQKHPLYLQLLLQAEKHRPRKREDIFDSLVLPHNTVAEHIEQMGLLCSEPEWSWEYLLHDSEKLKAFRTILSISDTFWEDLACWLKSNTFWKNLDYRKEGPSKG